MKLIFKYELDKELDNLKRGLASKNHPGELPELVLEMKEKGIDLDNDDECLAFFQEKLKDSEIDPDKRIESCNERWSSIAQEAERRFKELFQTEDELGEITAYLSVNRRCGYDIENKYFFVSFFKSNTNSTAIHELLHFYTFKYLLPIFMERKITRNDYGDFKEALTFLMNEKFSDLLEGYEDTGYPKQAELREFLIKKWSEDKDIYKLTENVITDYFNK